MDSYSQLCSTEYEDDRILGLLCRPMAAELVYPVGNVELRRKNDAAEGWNHKINSKYEIPHTRVQYIFACLKFEAENSEHQILRIDLNLEGVKRMPKYCQVSEGVAQNTRTYIGNGNVEVNF